MTTGPLSSRQIANMQRMFAMPFADLYPMYVAKVLRKNRTEADLRLVLSWLTGYTDSALTAVIDSGESLSAFFEHAHVNPNVTLITGSVCGVKVQEVEDPLMRNIRYMDKLVDELAQGKSLEKILRS
jgi:hypothetical protein